MALETVFELIENRVTRGDRRVKIVGNTGFLNNLSGEEKYQIKIC